MFSESSAKAGLSMRWVDNGADGPDAVAEVQASDGGFLLPMYGDSPAGHSVEIDTLENGTIAVASGGTTPSLTQNPVFGATGNGEQVTAYRVINDSSAASDDSAYVRAIEFRVD